MTALEWRDPPPIRDQRDGVGGQVLQPASFSTRPGGGRPPLQEYAGWDNGAASRQGPDVEGAGATAGLPDAQLVDAVARADDQALAELYRRHGRVVYGLARKLLADASEAEDITQEVFVRLWERPERFDSRRGSLRTYLLTQTHSRSVDLIRSRAARLRREERDARSAQMVTSNLEGQVWDLVVAERMSQALRALPAAERCAIELAYFGGHSYREVAEILSEPEGTVKSRIRKGLQRLRAIMDKVEGHDDRGS